MAGTFDPGEKMRRWFRRMDDQTHVLTAIGALMVEESQEAFEQQRFGKVPWPSRKVPNVFGIIADFSQAGTTAPPARRFHDSPVLKDKGALLASLTFRVMNTRTVEVGSWMKYAGKHHRGEETESETITKQVQAKLWAWLKKKDTFMKRRLGWLLNKKYTGTRLTMKLPERPIVGITNETRKAIRYTIGESFNRR